jgi:hypothetical protein
MSVCTAFSNKALHIRADDGQDVPGLFPCWSDEWAELDRERAAELVGVQVDQVRAVGVLSVCYESWPAGSVCVLAGLKHGYAVYILNGSCVND